MRIDYFHDSAITLEGAESIHVYEICKQFQVLGNEVRLFSPRTTQLTSAPFDFIPVWAPGVLGPIFYQFFVLPKLIRRWSKTKPSAVYLRVSPTLLLPVLLARLYRIPIFPEINGTIRPELEKNQAPTLLGKIQLALHVSDIVEKTVYRSARKIITVTGSIKDFISARFGIDPAKIVVVENGVDSDTLKPLHKPVSPKSKTVRLGYVGGLMWWQGLDFIVDALASEKLRGIDLEFVLVGDGPEKAQLEARAQKAGVLDRVKFMGKISHHEVAETINSFDICIAYYVKARAGLNSPFKVYEYLSCGRPTIVSDIANIGDVFQDIAAVAPAEDPEALAEIIAELAVNPNLRKDMGKKSRDYIVNGHTWKDTAAKILSVMNESMGRKQ